MIRSILGVIVGFVAGSVFNMAIILLCWTIYPLPAGANMSDPATMAAYVQTLPIPAFLLVLLAHAGGALVGGFVAALIARRAHMLLGGIIGALFLVGGIMSVMSIPSPLSFAIADLVSYLPCGIVGGLLASRMLRR